MKKVFLFSVVGILALFIGCGGGGGDDVANDGPSTNIVGLQFTEDNMADAALTGLDLLMQFPELSRVIALIIDTIETYGNLAVGNAPLDDSLCQGDSGTATLTWFDLHDLQDEGSMFLDLEDCIISKNPVTGDFDFTETIYNDEDEEEELLIAQMVMNLDVMESENGDTNTFNIHGNFRLRVSRTPNNGSTTMFFLFGGRDVDPGALLTLSDGSDQIRFGCFFVSVSFDPDSDEGTFMLGDHGIDPDSVYGVVVANRELFEISGSPPAPGDLADFVFVDSVPVSGNGIDYWGFLRGPGCGVVGAPDGVGQAGTANMKLYPEDTGVLLELYSNGFDQGDPNHSLYIDWDDFDD